MQERRVVAAWAAFAAPYLLVRSPRPPDFASSFVDSDRQTAAIDRRVVVAAVAVEPFVGIDRADQA